MYATPVVTLAEIFSESYLTASILKGSGNSRVLQTTP